MIHHTQISQNGQILWVSWKQFFPFHKFPTFIDDEKLLTDYNKISYHPPVHPAMIYNLNNRCLKKSKCITRICSFLWLIIYLKTRSFSMSAGKAQVQLLLLYDGSLHNCRTDTDKWNAAIIYLYYLHLCLPSLNVPIERVLTAKPDNNKEPKAKWNTTQFHFCTRMYYLYSNHVHLFILQYLCFVFVFYSILFNYNLLPLFHDALSFRSCIHHIDRLPANQSLHWNLPAEDCGPGIHSLWTLTLPCTDPDWICCYGILHGSPHHKDNLWLCCWVESSSSTVLHVIPCFPAILPLEQKCLKIE